MERLEGIWQEALTLMEEEFADQQISYKTWIKSITPITMTDDTISLKVPTPINKTMICERYMDLIRNSIFYITDKDYKVDVIVEGDKSLKPLILPDFEKEEKNENRGYPLNPQYTFDTYIIGQSNQFAQAAALAVAEAPSILYNPFFIHGGSGLGKTHLMNAIGNRVLETYPEKKVMYVSSEQFVNELINSIREQRNEEFRSKYRTIDVLIVDDIQFIAGKTSSEEEFFHTFNSLFLANKQIIISSDRPPKELHTLEERLRTRFESGLIVDIQPPDFETRAAILKQKAEQFKLKIDDEFVNYIASKVTSNVRELEGTIKKITALTGFAKKPVTREVVESALADFNVVNAGIITPSTIITLVEKHFNLKENSLVSSKRSKDVAFARQIAMYIMRELTEMSTPKIGQELGGRDHTTILHGIEKIERDINNDSTVKNLVNDIIKNIRNR
ncbi:MAG: chromosomal replication initiator protein DnaA [Clostridia bacterium]|nr:chromosomal replication initiator protein DnaA [Oscillospiraceae bacterium]MDY5627547.1 chromosomal replication initiator protein DnaA [Clostridia bacterium]